MTTTHPVTMTEVITSPARDNPNQERLGTGHGALPYDLPASLAVNRHLQPGEDGVPALVGWSLDVDACIHDAKVTIKFVRGGPLVVLLDGVEVGRS